MPDQTPGRSQSANWNKLIAGQAATDQRLDELFRRQDRVEETASEARDLAKEIVATLKAQDTAAQLAELKGEMTGQVSALRQDVVAANGLLRTALDEHDRRIAALEGERNKAVGVAQFFGWAARVAPWLFALCMAAWAGFESKGG